MQAIRNMEPAWEKVRGLKFQLLQKVYNLPNGGTKLTPYYSLTKTECLYIATKLPRSSTTRHVQPGPPDAEELEKAGTHRANGSRAVS